MITVATNGNKKHAHLSQSVSQYSMSFMLFSIIKRKRLAIRSVRIALVHLYVVYVLLLLSELIYNSFNNKSITDYKEQLLLYRNEWKKTVNSFLIHVLLSIVINVDKRWRTYWAKFLFVAVQAIFFKSKTHVIQRHT